MVSDTKEQLFSRHEFKGLSGDHSEKYPYPDRAVPPDALLLWPLFAPPPQLLSWMHYMAAILISSVWRFSSALRYNIHASTPEEAGRVLRNA
ncbi:hypothetical protein AB205_0217150 [Aquarana catesbeiana]|uniref:Uncharacterized protein n=1 Tax=Aquarana catesbeiana TaxID=8400 RepID=A0A2G9QLU5_AQUCT|nr:hypothetical protein AB205_0217150 [Aquarana catesbeiana]